MRLFVLSGRALPTRSTSDVGLFLGGETRGPALRPPRSREPFQSEFRAVRGEERPPAHPAPEGSWRLSLCFLNWQDAIIGKSLSCRPAGPTAPAPRRRPERGARADRGSQPRARAGTFGTKSRAPSSRPPSAPAPPRAAGPSQPPTAAPGSRRRGAPIHATGERPPAELGAPQTTGRAAWARPPGAALLASGRVSLSLSQPHRSGVGPASPGRVHPKGRPQAPHARQLARRRQLSRRANGAYCPPRYQTRAGGCHQLHHEEPQRRRAPPRRAPPAGRDPGASAVATQASSPRASQPPGSSSPGSYAREEALSPSTRSPQLQRLLTRCQAPLAAPTKTFGLPRIPLPS